MLNKHEKYMKIAIQQAIIGMNKKEVPIGSIIVYKNKIIAKHHNMTESLKNVTAHAEINNISSISNILKNKYLNKCIMYVTLEPCIMCAGALYWSKIKKLIFGAKNRQGFMKYRINLHPRTKIFHGILQEECENLLKYFFKKKRSNYKQ